MNKLMRFRKDRLFENDKGRLSNLIDALRNNRIIDDHQNGLNGNFNSPNKINNGKNFNSDVKNNGYKGN